MNLEPLYVQVLPRLAHTGSAEQMQGTLDLTSIDVGHRHFDLAQGIDYDISLTNTGEAVLLSGQASATLATFCDRCLNPTELKLAGEVQGYFLFDVATAPESEGLEVYEEVDKKGRIDIAPCVLAAIVVELPTVTLCGPQCEGPAAELKEASTAIESDLEASEDINPESPFAALKDFKFEE